MNGARRGQRARVGTASRRTSRSSLSERSASMTQGVGEATPDVTRQLREGGSLRRLERVEHFLDRVLKPLVSNKKGLIIITWPLAVLVARAAQRALARHRHAATAYLSAVTHARTEQSCQYCIENSSEIEKRSDSACYTYGYASQAQCHSCTRALHMRMHSCRT